MLTTPTYTNQSSPTLSPYTFDESPTTDSLQLSSNEVDEERIEGIESALEEFQKTIKQLRRKIRKLEHHIQINNKHNNGGKCMDADGNWRKNGDTWKKDKCTQCSCKVQFSSFSHVTVPLFWVVWLKSYFVDIHKKSFIFNCTKHLRMVWTCNTKI